MQTQFIIIIINETEFSKYCAIQYIQTIWVYLLTITIEMEIIHLGPSIMINASN